MACRFLRYTVEETLAGRADQLKEFVIGRQACGRGEDFDPRLDPVVRVQASKVRARLAEFYQNSGSTEPVRIELTKGSYVPEFRVAPPANIDTAPAAFQAANGGIWRQSRLRMWGVPAVAVAVMGVAGVSWLNWRGNAGSASGFEIRVPLSLPPPIEYYELATPALSPDGQRIAVTGVLGAAKTLYVLDVKAMDRPPRPLARAAVSPVFSPDGTSLAYFVNGDLMRLDQSGAARQLWKTRAGWTSPSGWSLSGEILFADGFTGPIYAIPAQGGQARAVTKVSPGARELGHLWPVALPDGTHFLYGVESTGSSRGMVYAGSLRDANFGQLVLDDSQGAEFVTPDKLVFVRGHDLYQQRFDTRSLRTVGEPMLLADNVMLLHEAIPAFSARASVLMWRKVHDPILTKLTWYDRLGEARGMIGTPAAVTNPVLAPDGRQLLGQIRNRADRSISLYDLSTGESRIVTPGAGDHFSPAWAADGRSFFFSSNRKGVKDIYRQWIIGPAHEELVLASELDKSVESVSPDGRWLVYNQQDRLGEITLWLLPVDHKGDPMLIGRGSRGSVAPNGRWLAYIATGGVLTVAPMHGTSRRAELRVGSIGDPQWSPDGTELLFLRGGDLSSMSVRMTSGNLEFGPPRRLFSIRPGVSPRNHFAVSPDGSRFVFDTPVPPKITDGLVLFANWNRSGLNGSRPAPQPGDNTASPPAGW
jgi:serine/threonine-protein kinase